ncbi:MAG: TIGR04282 family arsenosugar biosynthesis glycosyltransferase [Acidobacteriota bacterium]
MRRSLVLFAKSPRLGTVKTRLQTHLTPDQCLRLHEELIARTVETTQEIHLEGLEKAILFTGGLDEAFRHAGRLGIPSEFHVGVQFGTDLGSRMSHAIAGQFDAGFVQVVLIGVDCPLLSANDLLRAFEELAQNDVVIGPAHDGGYYLVGLSVCVTAIFDRIDWGSAQVYQQTIEALRRLDLKWSSLSPRSDLDTVEDLTDIWKALKQDRELASSQASRKLLDLFHEFLPEFPTGSNL